MKKLWIIGDSFSSNFYEPNEDSTSWKNLYPRYKGYIPKFFGQFVSEDLNMDYEILTKGIFDNYKMIELFVDNMDRFNEGDIVSFGWTATARIRFVDESTNQWEVINSRGMKGDVFKGMTVSTLSEIAVNRDHELYTKELIKWTKLISRSLPNVSIIHWTWTNNSYFRYETIADETQKKLNDLHWSENGHRQFSDWFIGVYKKEIENKCFDLM
jgi:hypothetical protein